MSRFKLWLWQHFKPVKYDLWVDIVGIEEKIKKARKNKKSTKKLKEELKFLIYLMRKL